MNAKNKLNPKLPPTPNPNPKLSTRSPQAPSLGPLPQTAPDEAYCDLGAEVEVQRHPHAASSSLGKFRVSVGCMNNKTSLPVLLGLGGAFEAFEKY